jgi:hypothetical protein
MVTSGNSSGVSYFDGDVGVGTDSPDGKLEIASNSSLSSYVTQYTNDADGAELVIRTARGTETTPVRYNTNDSAGRLLFQAYTSSNQFEDAASIESVMESGFANAYGGLRFNYLPAVSPYVLTEGMRLNMAGEILIPGEVGIGVTSSSSKLDISQGAGGTAQNVINSGEVAFRFSTKVEDTSINTAVFRQGIYHNNTENATIAFYRGGSSVGGFMTFQTQNGNERMRIDSSGNVGIGVHTPVTKLEVDSSTGNSSIKTGAIEMQSYAVNNAWIADNIYYDGAFRLRSAGYGSQVYFKSGGNITFNRYPTGNAGDAVTPVPTMVLASDGNVGIGTTTPAGKLHVKDGSVNALFVTSTTW